MGSEWTTIGAVSTVFDGPHATPKKTDEGPYFLSISSLENGKLDLSKSAKLSEEDFTRWTRRVTPVEGDVLFSYETRLGEAALMPEGLKACLGRRMGLLRPDTRKVVPRYLLYTYLGPDFQKEIRSRTNSGATVDRLSLKELPDFPIRIPPFSEQVAIAQILGTLDNKIELNRQINTTLEAMAQALFKSWFVDFDPVIDNALAAGNKIPAELAARAERRAQAAQSTASEQTHTLPAAIRQQFPDRFVFTDTMGWVPENWGVGTLLDQADLLSGGTPKTDVQEYWGGEIPWASAKDVSQCADAFLITTDKKITKRGLDKSATKLIDKYSTVIVSRGATTGRLAMFGDTFAMNQTCYALRSKNKNFFFQYCKTLDVTSKLVFSAHGSIFDTITTSTFKATPVILEDAALIKAFEQRVEPIFLRIYANLVQSAALSSTRDLLLPKLLSGQLRIPEAEQLVAEVI